MKTVKAHYVFDPGKMEPVEGYTVLLFHDGTTKCSCPSGKSHVCKHRQWVQSGQGWQRAAFVVGDKPKEFPRFLIQHWIDKKGKEYKDVLWRVDAIRGFYLNTYTRGFFGVGQEDSIHDVGKYGIRLPNRAEIRAFNKCDMKTLFSCSGKASIL